MSPKCHQGFNNKTEPGPGAKGWRKHPKESVALAYSLLGCIRFGGAHPRGLGPVVWKVVTVEIRIGTNMYEGLPERMLPEITNLAPNRMKVD